MQSTNTPAQVPTAAATNRNRPLFLGLLLVFVAFVTYTAIIAVDYGLIGFIKAAIDNSAVIQVSLDLVISLTIALIFIAGDARRRGLPFAPYLVATLFLGSIGPLAYLLHRTWRGESKQSR